MPRLFSFVNDDKSSARVILNSTDLFQLFYGIGVLNGGVGVRRGSTGPLGTGAALLTALVWEHCGGDGAVCYNHPP